MIQVIKSFFPAFLFISLTACNSTPLRVKTAIGDLHEAEFLSDSTANKLQVIFDQPLKNPQLYFFQTLDSLWKQEKFLFYLFNGMLYSDGSESKPELVPDRDIMILAQPEEDKKSDSRVTEFLRILQQRGLVERSFIEHLK
ncbi:MAG: hypothetical protein AAF804_08155 [Bacteroidota bacterium]